MNSLRSAGAALAFTTIFLFAPPVLADDWTAVKLRGVVMGLFDGEWVRLERGVVIPDDQAIRTLASGRVTLERGEETIEVGPDTQIQIVDRAGRSKHTRVKQYFGRIAVEAEVRDVTHFSVQTPHLAAVVKGTRFVVTSGDDGARVQVERGAVAVKDSANSSVVIGAGQEAKATPGAAMTVAGRGELPQVLDAAGAPVAKSPGFAGSSGNSNNSSFNASTKALLGSANAANNSGGASSAAAGSNADAGGGPGRGKGSGGSKK